MPTYVPPSISKSQLTNLLTNSIPYFSSQLDVKNYGAKGDGVTDDTAAIQSAITAAVNVGNNQGACINFPSGNYLISSALKLSNYLNIRFQGVLGSASKYITAPRSVLTYTGTGTGSLILSNPARGVALDSLGLTYSNTGYTGYLVDLRTYTGSNDSTGVLISNCSFYPSGSAGSGCVALLAIDGVETSKIANCQFTNGQYAIYGKIQNLNVGSQYFSLGLSIEDCFFAHQAIAAIRNPGESWSITRPVVEPLLSGGAGFLTQDSGFACQGLTIQGGWFADVTPGVSGAWINVCGSGISITGNSMGISTACTGISLSGNSCAGLSLYGNNFYGTNGPGSVGINFGSTVGHVGFVCLGNSFNAVTTPIAGTIPAGSIYSTLANPTIDTPTLTGVTTAVSGVFSGPVTTSFIQGGLATSANLFTYDDATFENAFITNSQGFAKHDFGVNNNCTIAASPFGLSAGGNYSMALTSTTSGSNGMSVYFPAPAGSAFALPVTPGQTYTFLSSWRAGTTPRTVQIKLYDITSGVAVNKVTSNHIGVETNSGWIQTVDTYTIPAGMFRLSIVLGILTVAGNLTIGEQHFVDNLSLAPGTSTAWAAPSTGVSTYMLDGTGITQVGTVVNNDMLLTTVGNGKVIIGGGNGGLVVGNGSGGVAPLSAGSLALSITTVTTGYAVQFNDCTIRCDTTSAGFTCTLPTAVGCPGRIYRFIKIDATGNTLTVGTTSSQTINGASTATTSSQYGTITVISNGVNWDKF